MAKRPTERSPFLQLLQGPARFLLTGPVLLPLSFADRYFARRKQPVLHIEPFRCESVLPGRRVFISRPSEYFRQTQQLFFCGNMDPEAAGQRFFRLCCSDPGSL